MKGIDLYNVFREAAGGPLEANLMGTSRAVLPAFTLLSPKIQKAWDTVAAAQTPKVVKKTKKKKTTKK